MMRRALVLFAHGGRNPEWSAPFERLQQILKAQLPGTAVALAFLELMKPGLKEAVRDLIQAGCTEITVVPVFLAQGGHVVRDLPVIVDDLRDAHPQVSFAIADAVGENVQVLQAIAQYCISCLPLR